MEVNEEYYTYLDYADDLALLGNSKQDLTRTLVGIINVSKRMVNQEKTKCMSLTKRTNNEEDTKDLKVDGSSFQQVICLKYLGDNI